MPLVYRKVNRFGSERLSFSLPTLNKIIELKHNVPSPVTKEELTLLKELPNFTSLFDEGVISLIKKEDTAEVSTKTASTPAPPTATKKPTTK